MTIFEAEDSRRTSVSLLRLLRISTCPKSVAAAAGAVAEGALGVALAGL
jgi:hypothetical protein